MLISDWSSDVCSSDLVLEQQPDVREHFSAAEEPIDDIPDSQWTAVPEVEAPHPEPQLTVHDFRWETDTSGMILLVDGIAREAVIGRTVALPEPKAIAAVAMTVATPFARIAPSRASRMCLTGSGEASGVRLISGAPCFRPAVHMTSGYRSTP